MSTSEARMFQNVKRGCDPELFLTDSKGNLVSSVGIVGGSKMNPMPILSGNGFAIQEDNVAVEFNIPPAKTQDEFKQNVTDAMSYLADSLSKKGLYLLAAASAEFPEEQLQTPEAMHFGCDPDFCAWTERMNRPPNAHANPFLRSAGGHLHISWEGEPKTIANQIMMVKAHDLFVGVPSVIFDDDMRRRSLYGKAGAYRPKDYGIEYRTLSNFWIKKPDMVDFIYSQSERAVEFLNEGGRFDNEEAMKDIPLAINNGDIDAVWRLNDYYGIL